MIIIMINELTEQSINQTIPKSFLSFSLVFLLPIRYEKSIKLMGSFDTAEKFWYDCHSIPLSLFPSFSLGKMDMEM
jgi:hypothetical protein